MESVAIWVKTDNMVLIDAYRKSTITKEVIQMAEQEVKYVPEGESGRTCADCKLFEPAAEDPSKGKCMGHDVEAKGSCNFFQGK